MSPTTGYHTPMHVEGKRKSVTGIIIGLLLLLSVHAGASEPLSSSVVVC